ncbi:MAG: pyridoxamine kinase [Eubacteriales bacterium]|nr:pyridoxamine kinase [Eubacteriales bacterium]
MKKIAILNDLSGLGKCSLTAAIPVISVMGVQACPLPTAILSNQTGYDSYYCDDYTDRMDQIMEEWEKRKFHPDGIYTGFVAGKQQVEKILKFLRIFRKEDTLLLVDPVMGDQGKVYDFMTQDLCNEMKRLAENADVLTPNMTEAILLLYGMDELNRCWQEICNYQGAELRQRAEEIAEQLVKKYHVKAVVITGIDLGQDEKEQIGNLILENGMISWVISPRYGGSYSGTGDLFASVLSAGMVKGMAIRTCVEKASQFLGKAIRDAVEEQTDRNDGICFETYLYELGKEG